MAVWKRDIADSASRADEPLSAAAGSHAKPEERPERRTPQAPSARPSATKSAIAAYALSFVVPFFVILFAFASNGIYPFGDVSVMMYDMPVQYAQFFGWLSNVINGDASLLYSADAGMGCGTYAQYTYYLSSPLNALVFLCDPSQVPYFFSFLFLVKIPLAAVTCLVFLRGRFAAAGAKGSCATQVLAVVGAIAYSLTSYVTGYSSNIMWIDGVIMAPLACLGVYRLVRGRGCAALFASCACAILFNWYTGYMVCFFTIFYFFYEYARLRIEESERACDEGELRLGSERERTNGAGKRNEDSANETARIAPKNRKLAGHPLIHLGLRYAATMILAVGASAVILFPTLIALLGGKGSGAGLAALAGTIFSLNPFDYANFFAIGTRPGIIVANATPAIVISALVLVGVAVFFADARRSRALRIAGAVIMGIPASSLVLIQLNTIWLGFVPESSYTGRMAFLLLLMMVALAFEGIAFCLDNKNETLVVAGNPKNRPVRHTSLRAVVKGGAAAFLIFGCATFNVWYRTLSIRPSAANAVLELVLITGFTAFLALMVRQDLRVPAEGNAREKRATGRKILARTGIACLVVLFAFEQCYGTAAQYAACNLSASEYSNRIAELEKYYEDYPTDNGFARTGQTCVYYGSSKYNGPDCTGLVLSGSGSFDLYSSTQENSVQNLLMRLGYSKKTPFGTAYQSPNTAADALLSVTNVIAEEQPPETELVADHAHELYGSYRDWKATSSMPLGYGIAATAEETELANEADYSGAAADATDDEPTDAWSANPFNNQIAMYASVTGADASGLYHKATAVDAGTGGTDQRDFTVTTTSAGPLFLYFPSIYLLDIEEAGISCYAQVNGVTVEHVGGRGSCNVVYAGTFDAGETVTVSIVPTVKGQTTVDKHGRVVGTKEALFDAPIEAAIKAETLDVDEMKTLLGKLDSAGFSLKSFSNGQVSATFDAQHDETLLVSIPYEKGWSATVNGHEVPVHELYGGLLGIDVTAGTNDIELHYMTPGLIPSAIISIASVAAFCAWRAFENRRHRTRATSGKRAAQ